MGPIRAFVRPSCAAATPDHSHAPASFFCPTTQPFPSHHQHPHHHHHHHRPYCAHIPATLPPHHHHYLHHHHHHHPSSRHPLYIATAGGGSGSSSSSPSPSDPQRVGLVVSPGPKPSLYSHFKKFLPPGVPLAGPLPVLSALSQGQGKGWRAVVDGGGVGGLECEGKWDEGQKDYEWGRREKGEKGSSKDKGESPDKRNSSGEEIKWKKDCSQNKWKTGSTCNSSTSSGSAICNGSKLDPSSPKSQWRKTNDEGGIREAGGGGEEAKGKRDSRVPAATTPLTACLSSLLKKHEDPLPSTSRVALVFPFSEDEDEYDDEDNGYDDCCEGGGAVPGGESRRVTWPISDIVETEDEEGETLQAVKDVANEKGIREDEKEEKETNYRLLATGKHCKGEKDREEEEGELRKGGKNRDLEVKKAGKEEPDSNQRKSAKPTDLSDACRVLNHLVNVVIKHPHVRVPEGTLVSAAPASAAGGVLQETDKGRKRDEVTVSHQGRSSHPPLTEEHSEGTVADSSLNKKEKRPSGDVLLGKDGRTREGEVTGSSKKAEEEEGEEEEEDHEEREEGEEEGEKQKDGVRATQRLRPRSYRQFLLTRERRSRVFLKERSYHLGRWFVTHFTHPYPSKEQKDVLAAKTKMTRNQVSEWFGNMRRRIREATRGRGICWEERVRIYNSVITGKSEPLPIMPEDEINTWVPPVAQDPPTTDPHEEVSASQKFKTTLLHRYLNNSEAGDFCSADGLADSTNSAPINATATFIVNSSLVPTSGGDFLRHYQEGPSTSSDTAETQTEGFLSNHFPHIFPLCTSSPKENIKKLWNNSFEHIKDNYMPPVNSRIVIKEQRVKPVQGGSSDETRKLAKRSETMLHGDEGMGQTSAKKARIAVSPNREWFQRPSTSKYPSDQGVICSQFEAEKSKDLLRSHIVSGPKVPLSCWGIRRPVIEHSRSIGEKSSEEEHSRQPEELAAAYTLMQLQHM